MGVQLQHQAVPDPSQESPVNNAIICSPSLNAQRQAISGTVRHFEATLQQPAHVFLSHSNFGDDLEKQLVAYTARPPRSLSSMTSQTLSTHNWATDSMQPENRLPAERGSRLYRAIRWQSFSTYYRLFTLVILANLGVCGYINFHLSRALIGSPTSPEMGHGITAMLTAVSANLMASIAMRNEHVINFLFRVFVVHVPHTAPLRFRRTIAKVYCFGGIHSGAGLMAALWYTSFTAWTIIFHSKSGGPSSSMERSMLGLTGLNWLLFVAIVTAAHPRVRSSLHDYFEFSHRFCGWLLLASFWVQTILSCITDVILGHRDLSKTFGSALLRIPTFWMLLSMTALIIYPWLRAKHNTKVEFEKLSDHATRIHFKTQRVMPPCRVIRISDNLCRETHAFATIPEPNGKPGFSIIVSNAGDWTQKMIHNPPKRLSIKGCPTWGVLRIATMFKPVVIVATGSGIGPCIGLFNGCPELMCRVLWSTKTPELTYGKEVVHAVRRADPNARIYDSSIYGRINLAQLAYDMYMESRAEAVIVISNKSTTTSVVQTLECRGVAAFGPIWDS